MLYLKNAEIPQFNSAFTYEDIGNHVERLLHDLFRQKLRLVELFRNDPNDIFLSHVKFLPCKQYGKERKKAGNCQSFFRQILPHLKNHVAVISL